MSHFMRHCYMRDCWWHVLSIVKEGDDASVETLQASSVVLKFERKMPINKLAVLKRRQQLF